MDGNEVGIDGLAVQVNGRIVTDPDEVAGLARTNGYLEVTFLFIQAKTTEGFDAASVELMGRAVKDFFGDAALPKSEFLSRSRAIRDAVYKDAVLFRQSNPRVEAFMVTTGRWDEPLVVRNSMRQLEQELAATRLFSKVEIEPVDADALNDRYRRTLAPPEASIDFARRSTIPRIINGVQEAYVGVLSGAEFLKLIEDEDGRLRTSVFEDNVRDFQGADTHVNRSMAATIASDDFSRFVVLNNGVTVIARRLNTTGDATTVTDYQIVNGCQTANMIHAYAERARDDDFLVPVKLIATDDEELITEIVMATNSQTLVRTEDLNSRSRFERRLEQFFEASTFDGERGLRYERRSRQYVRDARVPAARVITRRVLVRSYVSMFRDQPHRATGNVTDLLGGLGTSHFVDDHQLDPYYVAGMAHWKLDNMFQGRINRDLKPARWYLLMVFRHLALDAESLAAPQSNKIKKQATRVRRALKDDARALDLFTRAGEIIFSTLGTDFDRDQLRGERPVALLRHALLST